VNRIWAILIGLDQTANAAAGGNPDETISSRAAKEALAGNRWAIIREAAIDLIFALAAGQRHHCHNAIEWDEV